MSDEYRTGGAEVPRDFEMERGGAMPGRLDAWMARVETKLDLLGQDMAQLKGMRGEVDDHHERLFGNGQPGILKDVDRLKQWRQSLLWLIGLLSTATAALLFSMFIKKP